jgi:polyhydroxybutyrate depolymerase
MRSKFILPPLLLVTLFFAAACGPQRATVSGTTTHNSSATPTTNSSSASSNIQRDYTESMQEGALTRTYYIHLPKSYNKQEVVPLVLAFHGSSSNGKALAQETHLNDVADAGDFIVVYPDGYQGQWADGRGTTPPEQAGVDDVTFVSDLIDKLTSELAINQNRVYVTGMSNGGIFSERLACELAYKITAIASVSGTMAENISGQCQPARPIPVMLFMGTDDPSVPFGGGEVDGNQGIDLSADDTIQQWVTHNECSTTPIVTQAPPATNDGTSVLRSHYGSCKDNADVILYTIDGGVHAWPGSADPVQTSGPTTHLDASQVMWKFFQHHTM